LNKKSTIQSLAAAASIVCVGTTELAVADIGIDTTALTEAVTTDRVLEHLQTFQQFSDDNGGNREASSDGFFESVKYVSSLMAQAGYDVNLQLFPYIYFENQTEPVLDQISPEAISYLPNELDGFATMTYSGSGDTTALAEVVDIQLPPGDEANASTSGCEESDFDGFTEGNIAIIQRGACTFGLKAANAEAAGAAGVVIFNEGQDGRQDAFGGTLGESGSTIPVVGTSFAIGETLAAGDVEIRLAVDAVTEVRISTNIIADSPIGREDKVLVVGAHLDSVPEGPGINDNGSGAAGILEIALQLSELGFLADENEGLRNQVRFAWWGAEEEGLLGSEHYVSQLSEEELGRIALNLNFDMIASPNYVRFVYDGDGSASEVAGPEGSSFIEWIFHEYFDARGLLTEPTAFDGRSDYGPFIEAGVPAGGLFTGAEGIKTAEQEGNYGGTAEEAYDACYHAECDTIENINLQALDEMTDAVAHAVMLFGMKNLPQVAEAKRSASSVVMDYKGNHLIR